MSTTTQGDPVFKKKRRGKKKKEYNAMRLPFQPQEAGDEAGSSDLLSEPCLHSLGSCWCLLWAVVGTLSQALETISKGRCKVPMNNPMEDCGNGRSIQGLG